MTLNDVSPDAASVGSQVTLTGTGFGASQGASQVFVAGVDAGTAGTWTDTSITLAVPAGAGTGLITVRVGSLTSNSVPFIVSAPAALGLPLARVLDYSPSALARAGVTSFASTTDGEALSSTQESVAVGDLDEDGNPDIVTTIGGSSCVFLGDGNGRFAPGACTTFGEPVGPGGGLGIADVDEDGHLDLVESLNGTVAVLLGDGAGSFGTPLVVAQLPTPYYLLLVDLDTDAHLDVVVRNGNALHRFRGDGTGAFVPDGEVSVGTGPHAIGSGDLNGDGWPDLVTSNYSSGDLSVVLSDGVGGFLPEQRIDVDTSPTGLVVEDLSGDGKVDVAVTHDGFSSTNAVRVFLGNGQGQLAAGQVIREAGMMQSLATADMNGDGVLDLLAGSNAGVHTLLGYGDGTFVHWASSYATYARGIAVGDFNRDGRADIAQHGLIGSPVMLGDGSGRFAEPIRVKLEAVGLNGVRAADLDADGNADLVVLDEVSSELQALMGDGTGGFTVTATPLLGLPQPGGEYSLGDFDGDGHTDAIVSRAVRLCAGHLLGMASAASRRAARRRSRSYRRRSRSAT
ncbi:MAG: VCBS repeat-containing protein [Deltaproteobacteria bacterium]|nr:VCBS repeat-containing protein [Deltaproteobacteria bacterium]